MKAGLFVCPNNIFYNISLKFSRGAKIDYAKYLETALESHMELYRAFAFGVQMTDEAEPFIKSLEQIGFECRYREAKIIEERPGITRPSIRYTDINVGMAMEVMRNLHKLDVVIIGSNDSDLVPLIRYIRERGVKTIIYACRVGIEMKESVDELREIGEEILAARTMEESAS